LQKKGLAQDGAFQKKTGQSPDLGGKGSIAVKELHMREKKKAGQQCACCEHEYAGRRKASVSE